MAEVVRLVGLEGVVKTLRALPPELVSKRGGPIRAALRKGAVIIRNEMQANIRRIVAEPNIGGLPSESTGALEQAVTIKRRRGPEGGGNGEAFSVGVGRLKAKIASKLGSVLDPSFYAWFLELGTEKMRPHPFARPAYEVKKGDALAAVVTGIVSGVARIVRKLERQNRVIT